MEIWKQIWLNGCGLFVLFFFLFVHECFLFDEVPVSVALQLLQALNLFGENRVTALLF